MSRVPGRLGHVTPDTLLPQRPAFLSQKLEAGDEVKVRVRKASGETSSVSLPWQSDSPLVPTRESTAVPSADDTSSPRFTFVSERAARIIHAERTAVGETLPFFLRPEAHAALGAPARLVPSTAALTKFGLAPEQVEKVDYFAIKYERDGKKILLLRIPSFIPHVEESVALNYLRALIDEQQPQVDALVIDVTHNPGGSVSFALGLVSLLTPREVNGLVQRMHADRLWIGKFVHFAAEFRKHGEEREPMTLSLEEGARLIDEAYGIGQPLSVPLPLPGTFFTIRPDAVHWNKPLLVLADELSVSCADFFPMLIKENGLGQVFGQQTMGGGGNVEQLATLPHTQAKLSLTRGLGTVFDPTGVYPESLFIEDQGVTPDIEYNHTLEDFRAGYVGYVNAFTDAVLRLTQPTAR